MEHVCVKVQQRLVGVEEQEAVAFHGGLLSHHRPGPGRIEMNYLLWMIHKGRPLVKEAAGKEGSMGRFHLRKYCYLVLWAALLAAVAGVWFFGRAASPPGKRPPPQRPRPAPPPPGRRRKPWWGCGVPLLLLEHGGAHPAGLCGKLPDHRPNRPGEGDERPVCPRAALLRRLVPPRRCTPGPTSSPAPRARTRALTPCSL